MVRKLALKELSRKEAKTILLKIAEQFGIEDIEYFLKRYIFFSNKSGKIYILSKETSSIVKDKDLPISHFGLYIASVEKSGVRLSIEGSQLFGSFARKNIVEISRSSATLWMAGFDINISAKNSSYQGFVLIKCKNSFLGCGYLKSGKILNYIPKHRRINISHKDSKPVTGTV